MENKDLLKKGLVFNIKKYSINDGPGIRTTVYLKGCFLRCQWCDNPEGQNPKAEVAFSEIRCLGCQECVKNCPRQALSRSGSKTVIDRRKCDLCGACVQNCFSEALVFFGQEMSVEEVMKEVDKDRIFYEESNGGVTFCGGEPLLQIDFLAALLEECRRRYYHTCLDTSGCAPAENLEKICDMVDLFLYDLKMMDEEKHRLYTNDSNRIILENLARLAAKGKKIIIRIPLIAGINDTAENIVQTAEFLKSLVIREIDLIPCHKLGSQKYKKLDRVDSSDKFQPPAKERLKEIKEKLEKFGFAVRIL